MLACYSQKDKHDLDRPNHVDSTWPCVVEQDVVHGRNSEVLRGLVTGKKNEIPDLLRHRKCHISGHEI